MTAIVFDTVAYAEKLEANLTTKLAETKADLIKWYIGTMFAMTSLILGLMKFIH
jgi:hypothetical protein